MTQDVTIQDLHRELDDLQSRHGRLKQDELFVLWFLRAYVTADEEAAHHALTGGVGDKDADAVLIDDRTRSVAVVQGKFRKAIGGKAEPRNAVMGFARLAEVLCGEEGAFEDHSPGLAPDVRDRLKDAREGISKRGYRLTLYYVTLGRFTPAVRDAATKEVRRNGDGAIIEFIDGKRALRLLSDYLDGVAPPIPSLDLPVETGQGVELSAPLSRYDSHTRIDARVFSMKGDDVGKLYEEAGIRIFARNIRGFLGNTKINQGMQDTIHKEPEHFWYFNNGITIVCDGVKEVTSRGQTIVRVSNPQIINGQQTTRVLAETKKRGRQPSVLVRVIAVERDGELPGQEFEGLISNIVAATNWQNAIRPSDLRANDRLQVELGRQLRKLNYGYLRKRQTKREARRAIRSRKMRLIKKEELAQAVAACELDPVIVRLGKERLFEEDRYRQVFPTGDPLFYLTRYWTMRSVGYVSKGYPERAYAKWLALHFVWSEISPLLRGRAAQDAFVRECEGGGDGAAALTWAIDKVFVAALRFYRKNRGKGAKAADVSSYFQRRGLHRDFATFWRGRSNPSRKGFNRYVKEFQDELREVTER